MEYETGLLVLTRGVGEKVVITCPNGDRLEVMVVDVRYQKKVRIGFKCPDAYRVMRQEIQERIDSGVAKDTRAS